MKNLTMTMFVTLFSLAVVVSATAQSEPPKTKVTAEAKAEVSAEDTATPCPGPRRMSERSQTKCTESGGKVTKTGELPTGCECPDRDWDNDGDNDPSAFDWWFGCRDESLVQARHDAERESSATAKAIVRFDGLFEAQAQRDQEQDERLDAFAEELSTVKDDVKGLRTDVNSMDLVLQGTSDAIHGTDGTVTEDDLIELMDGSGLVGAAKGLNSRMNSIEGRMTTTEGRLDKIRQAYFRIMFGFTGSVVSTPVITWSDDSDELVRGVFTPMVNVGVMIGAVDKISAGAAGTAELQLGPGMSTNEDSGLELAIRLGGNALLPMISGWHFAPGAFLLIQSTDTQFGNPDGSRATGFMAGGSIAFLSPDQLGDGRRIPAFFARLDVGGGGVHYEVSNTMGTEDTADDEHIEEDKGAFGGALTVGVAF